jgi:predicted permease
VRPALVVGFWAALLALWTALQLIFGPHWVTVALLGGAAAAVALLALVTALARPRRRPEPDLSPAPVLLAFGVTALLSGTELGPWALAIGALLVAAGLARLAAER